MGVVLEDVRKRLLEKLGVDNQKHIEAISTLKEINEFIATLSTDDIAELIKKLNQEFDQNRKAKNELEKKNYGLRKLIMAIQARCPHTSGEVESEEGGIFKFLVCKLCGRLRTGWSDNLPPSI